MLDHTDSVKLLMDAIRCHCKNYIGSDDNLASLRDIALLMVEKALVEHAEEKEIDNSVNSLLEECGLA